MMALPSSPHLMSCGTVWTNLGTGMCVCVCVCVCLALPQTLKVYSVTTQCCFCVLWHKVIHFCVFMHIVYCFLSSITILGTGAKWLWALEERGVCPRETHHLTSLHTILSTGSPLKPQSYDYVYSRIKNNVLLGSITGTYELTEHKTLHSV